MQTIPARKNAGKLGCVQVEKYSVDMHLRRPAVRDGQGESQMSEIGIRIRECRKDMHMTQIELANKVGLTTATAVSSWEKGRNEPDLDTVVILSEILHVSIDYSFSAFIPPL